MAASRLIYEELSEWTRDAVAQALRDDDPALQRAVLAVAMYDADWRFAQDLCVTLATHHDVNVRANALTGFGHIARVHRKLDRELVQPIIAAALLDDQLRGHGVNAADDTAHFLCWRYD